MPVTAEYSGEEFSGEIEKAKPGFDLYLDGEKVGNSATWKAAQADLAYEGYERKRNREREEYLHQGLPEGTTVKRGAYNQYTDHYRTGNTQERYAQKGEMVAIRPKRDGDFGTRI